MWALLNVMHATERPIRAAAEAASQPACPAPTTTTSNRRIPSPAPNPNRPAWRRKALRCAAYNPTV